MSLVPIDVKEKNFQTLMLIYEQAMLQVKRKLESFQTSLKEFYNYDVINNINCRIKTPESIINKMKKKNYDLNYKELIGNVNDIAGIRIVCPFKTDIFKIKDTIEEDSLIEILEIKDYVHKPKKTGYSGFHIIGQTPVNIGDFWSTVEHKIKYKAKNKLSKFDSMKMIHYAKIINKVDTKITKINSKYLG